MASDRADKPLHLEVSVLERIHKKTKIDKATAENKLIKGYKASISNLLSENKELQIKVARKELFLKSAALFDEYHSSSSVAQTSKTVSAVPSSPSRATPATGSASSQAGASPVAGAKQSMVVD